MLTRLFAVAATLAALTAIPSSALANATQGTDLVHIARAPITTEPVRVGTDATTAMLVTRGGAVFCGCNGWKQVAVPGLANGKVEMVSLNGAATPTSRALGQQTYAVYDNSNLYVTFDRWATIRTLPHAAIVPAGYAFHSLTLSYSSSNLLSVTVQISKAGHYDSRAYTLAIDKASGAFGPITAYPDGTRSSTVGPNASQVFILSSPKTGADPALKPVGYITNGTTHQVARIDGEIIMRSATTVVVKRATGLHVYDWQATDLTLREVTGAKLPADAVVSSIISIQGFSQIRFTSAGSKTMIVYPDLRAVITAPAGSQNDDLFKTYLGVPYAAGDTYYSSVGPIVTIRNSASTQYRTYFVTGIGAAQLLDSHPTTAALPSYSISSLDETRQFLQRATDLYIISGPALNKIHTSPDVITSAFPVAGRYMSVSSDTTDLMIDTATGQSIGAFYSCSAVYEAYLRCFILDGGPRVVFYALDGPGAFTVTSSIPTGYQSSNSIPFNTIITDGYSQALVTNDGGMSYRSPLGVLGDRAVDAGSYFHRPVSDSDLDIAGSKMSYTYPETGKQTVDMIYYGFASIDHARLTTTPLGTTAFVEVTGKDAAGKAKFAILPYDKSTWSRLSALAKFAIAPKQTKASVAKTGKLVLVAREKTPAVNHRLTLTVTKAQALKIGLRVPKGKDIVTIGQAVTVNKKAGAFKMVAKLTMPARAAIKSKKAAKQRISIQLHVVAIKADYYALQSDKTLILK